MSVDWQEPPLPHKGVWIRRLEPLKAKPGKWARVLKTPTAKGAYNLHGTLIRRAVILPEGEWEFRAAKTDDGSGEIYARFLAPENKSAALVSSGN